MGVYEKKNGVYVRTDGGLIQKPVYTASEVGAVPSPAVAEVGQVMMISEVDASGRPIAWEPYKDPKYEFINTITLGEDATSVSIIDEPDGTPLELTDLYLVFRQKGLPESRKIYFSIGNTRSTGIWTEDQLFYGAVEVNTNETYDNRVIVETYKGLVRGRIIRNAANSVLVSVASNSPRYNTGTIKAIRVFAYGNTTNIIPAGSTIEIWGVRA